MNTVGTRLILYRYFKKLFDTDSPKKKMLTKGRVLGQGGQGKVYCYYKKNGHKTDGVAVKRMYLDTKESKYVDDIFNAKAFRLGPFIELSTDILINEILQQNISQNFIFTYEYEFVERDGVCSDMYPFAGLFYKEYIDKVQTYTEWVKEEHDLNIWYSAYFQIISAVYVLKKYFNMTHLDLHSDNILVKKIKKGGYWAYIINNKLYKVPNYGYVFYIMDFGHAYIPNTFRSWLIKGFSKKAIHKGFDIYQLFKSTLKISSSPPAFKKHVRLIIKQLQGKQPFETLIDEIWGEKYERSTSKLNIETYTLDKPLSTTQLPNQLRDLVIY